MLNISTFNGADTMDLKKKIEIILKKQYEFEHNGFYWDRDGEAFRHDITLVHICNTADEWIGTDFEGYFTEIINNNINADFYEGLTKPLSERHWVIPLDNRGSTPRRDMIFLRGQLGADYYVYVHDCFEGAYGKQFEVAVNGGNDLYLLPTIKQFTEELTVGKCFIIHFEKEIEFGNGRKKYCYQITEISEDEYLDGVIDAHIKTVAY